MKGQWSKIKVTIKVLGTWILDIYAMFKDLYSAQNHSVLESSNVQKTKKKLILKTRLACNL